MSRSVRQRPVDIAAPLTIHHGVVDDKELRYEDENGNMRTVIQGDSGGATESVVTTKPDEIVVQNATIVDEYFTMPHKKFNRPHTYLKQKKSVDADREYVVDEDDMEWVDKYNKKDGKPELTYDLLEIMIDVLERSAKGATLELATAEKLSYGKVKVVVELIRDVHSYWDSKRNRLSNSFTKALTLRYRVLKNHEDPDPNVVFRPREREYQTRKKTRKNDKKSFQKMVELRLNFERTRHMTTLICLVLSYLF